MKPIVKTVLNGFLFILVVFIFLMLVPRIHGFLFPEKAPWGYHYEVLDYLALGVGLEKMAELEPEIPESIEEIRDIEYKQVGEKSLQLDIYKPRNLAEPSPLLVFIHGGAWRHGERSDYLVYLVDYAEKGYMTATLSYRLDTLYPGCVEDIADAIDWLMINGTSYGADTSKIALIGGSAGGHLSLLGGYNWRYARHSDTADSLRPAYHRIAAVVDIYGPVDLTTPYAQSQPLVTRFIGHSYADRPDLYLEASPVQYLKKDLPPTLIFQGTSDNLVPRSQSDTLKARLDRLGVPCEYYTLPLWPHTMDVAERPNRYMQKKMDAFFEKYLR